MGEDRNKFKKFVKLVTTQCFSIFHCFYLLSGIAVQRRMRQTYVKTCNKNRFTSRKGDFFFTDWLFDFVFVYDWNLAYYTCYTHPQTQAYLPLLLYVFLNAEHQAGVVNSNLLSLKFDMTANRTRVLLVEDGHST